MKVALIGASGYTGVPLLNELLQRGHEVTAIVRNPGKITTTREKLTVKQADATDAIALAEVVKGHDAVISAYNPGWGDADLYNSFINGSKAIQEGVTASGVKRFLVIGGAGSLEIAPGKQLVDTPEFPAEWKVGATAARDYLNLLKKSKDLDWTFLSPAINLVPGERTGHYKLGTDNPVFNADNKSEISTADLAVALVDELEKGVFIQKRFTVGY